VRRATFDASFEDWRRAARVLLAEDVSPDDVEWSASGGGGQASLFARAEGGDGEPDLAPDGVVRAEPGSAAAPHGSASTARPAAAPAATHLRLSRDVLERLRLAAHHRDPGRWGLLYRLVWRLAHGEPHLFDLATDPDVLAFHRLARQVRRDAHKAKAFVRFRRVAEEGGERWVAWHRPDHDVLALVAPFFVERFGAQRWAILTPQRSAAWDGDALTLGPGVAWDPAASDAEAEELWRAYYASTFNPSRLDLRTMRRELPSRHWATLPETRVVPALVREAAARSRGMIEEERPAPASTWLPAEPTIPALAAAVHRCRACPLWRDADRAVFGEGDPDARLVLVGEQPGDREDEAGRPFVGPAGALLDQLLERAGLPRERLWLTNAVKHFKFERRGKQRIHKTPAPVEVSACFPWLAAELAALRPSGILCLGATAARAVLGPGVRVRRDRGRELPCRWAPWAAATWHPAALLRLPPEARPQAEAELLADLTAVAAVWRAAASSPAAPSAPVASAPGASARASSAPARAPAPA
jgi:DNA polymerase